MPSRLGDVVNLVGFIPTTLNAEGLEVKAVNGNTLELATKDTVAGLPVAQTFGTIEESLVGVTATGLRTPGSVLAGEFQVPAGQGPNGCLPEYDGGSQFGGACEGWQRGSGGEKCQHNRGGRCGLDGLFLPQFIPAVVIGLCRRYIPPQRLAARPKSRWNCGATPSRAPASHSTSKLRPTKWWTW